MAKAKRYKWVENADGTSTFEMVAGGRTESVTKAWATYDECKRAVDLFVYFGIDSVLAGKPAPTDLARIAAKAAR